MFAPSHSNDLRSSLKGVLRKSCALDLLSRATARDRVEVFLYHGFCPGSKRDPRFPKLLPIEQFEEHIRTYARYARPLPIERLRQPGASGVVITFDDGYDNNYELAFPVLKKYEFPASIFLTTGFLDRSTPLWGNWLEFLVMSAPLGETVFEWRATPIPLQLGGSVPRAQVVTDLRRRLHRLEIAEIHEFLRGLETHLHIRHSWDVMPKVLRPLSWDHVRTMHASGLVSIGCHTVSHPVLSRCTREVQRLEVVGSKRRVEEELGEECTAFAYPYGSHSDYTEVTKQITKEAGFQLALSAEPGSTRSSFCDHHEIRRWGADLAIDELSFLVSGGPLISRYLKKCN